MQHCKNPIRKDFSFSDDFANGSRVINPLSHYSLED